MYLLIIQTKDGLKKVGSAHMVKTFNYFLNKAGIENYTFQDSARLDSIDLANGTTNIPQDINNHYSEMIDQELFPQLRARIHHMGVTELYTLLISAIRHRAHARNIGVNRMNIKWCNPDWCPPWWSEELM